MSDTFMYYADLEVEFEDGSKGMRCFEGISLESVQKQASDLLKKQIAESKFAEQVGGEKCFRLVKHKITAGKKYTNSDGVYRYVV